MTAAFLFSCSCRSPAHLYSFRVASASSASDAGRQMERYTRTAMLLHWLIALAIVAQIGFGWDLQQIPRRTPDGTLYVNYHKSTGMLIGLLILARIAWRLKHQPPGLPASMPARERRLPGAQPPPPE